MIRTDHAHLPVVAATHSGMTGKNNEDRYAVSAFRLRSKGATRALLAVLSDGIGGHRAGEVAAEIAVETISKDIAESGAGDPIRILRHAIQAASQEIRELARSDPNRQGMGATCVCAWIIGRRLYTATVGDSRLYLLRGGAIRQLSTDHTWVQEALDQGLLQPEQVAGHPNSHVIRRYLGAPIPPEVDVRLRMNDADSDPQAEANQGMLLEPGDRLLLCSDGLTDMVDDAEILAAFQAYAHDAAVNNLVALANQRGGLDNITLVAIAIPAESAFAAGGWRRRIFSWSCLGLLALGLLGALIFAGVWYSNGGLRRPTPTAVTTATAQIPLLAPPLAVPSVTVTPTRTPLGPEIFGTPVPQATDAQSATLTPWPTNTSAPGPTNTLTSGRASPTP